ncbi:S1C family serine protease [Micromonospora sp. C28SCA-DRY-2]|uniref:S1C family serine protease n=1 Tax=Micromonospora sp. C28SCA-DRY-2 TaxID=3059522 RepID=UPI0026766B09|nr:S1C family serine protease [Micromonospora sp. C28SCA-DRY-2]MDO3700441.1 S1C family serine protease [Micromonospora sp. C28SCA-DRY-2]
MTAGYGSGGTGPGAGDGSGGAPPDGSYGRPGPLPPRVEPPRPPAGYPAGQPAGAGWSPPQQGQWGQPAGAAAAPAYPPASAPPAAHPPAAPGHPPAPTPGARPPAAPGQPAAGGAPAYPPAGPGQPPAAGPSYPPASGSSYPPATASSFPPASGSGFPPAGASGFPPAGDGWPGAGPAAPAAPPRGRWRTVVVALVAAVLAVVTIVQAIQLKGLSDRLGDTGRRLDTAQATDGTRLDGLEQRTEALEKQAGAAFNPEAVASAVLPSVFRVRAGQFTGTAFAIGKPAAGGGTNLFTNFHVVEAVWDGGGREVFLERTDQRFPATIVKVDEANDIAHLRTTSKFTGLVAASTAVKSGQQIVVVGAPLGLEDSVTTGVVSAFRKAEGGDGPVIQFDAPINPGNSGGPVVNGSKQVVGIATAKARDAEGIGLAVPIKTACDGFKIC